VVVIGDNAPIALDVLIETFRAGVVGAFRALENLCEIYHRDASTFHGENGCTNGRFSLQEDKDRGILKNWPIAGRKIGIHSDLESGRV
jgi:hypothetical protein